MMIHHGGDYNAAASSAAAEARKIMQAKIDEGQASVQATVERVLSAVPQDRLALGKSLAFSAAADSDTKGRKGLLLSTGGGLATIHPHALGQMSAKGQLPSAWIRESAEGPEWRRSEAADILTRHYTKDPEILGKRHLVRAVMDSGKAEVRGFLSDKFRRLDSRPLLEAFVTAVRNAGAVITTGVATDTRVAVKAYLPIVLEPVPNEVLCWGVEWSNSDFGAGMHACRTIVWRLWCTNRATLEDTLRQVHLGARISDDAIFSDRTYRLDTEANVSALGDIVSGALSPDRVKRAMTMIHEADAQKLSWETAKRTLAKSLGKAELAAVGSMFASEDVVNLPAAPSPWRLSNVLSLMARRTEDPDKRLDLERLAGGVLTGKLDVAHSEAN